MQFYILYQNKRQFHAINITKDTTALILHIDFAANNVYTNQIEPLPRCICDHLTVYCTYIIAAKKLGYLQSYPHIGIKDAIVA